MVMEEALKEYFKGELLEGDNAYNCEKCNEKVTSTWLSCVDLVMVVNWSNAFPLA